MAIKWRINPDDFMDKVEVARVEKAVAILKVEDVTAIDSYTMSPNGPVLASIFLVGGGYLAEVRMDGKHFSFDFGPKSLVDNYRITYGEHESQAETVEASPATAGQDTPPEAKRNMTQLVTLRLTHTPILATTVTFFGNGVEEWLQFVLETLPANIVID